MVGGTIHREVIHGEISRVLVLHPALATTRCAKHCRAELRLDNAFVLIEGHPPLNSSRSPSATLCMPAARSADTCRKTSRLPLSGTIKPNPFWLLKNFTLPIIGKTPCRLTLAS